MKSNQYKVEYKSKQTFKTHKAKSNSDFEIVSEKQTQKFSTNDPQTNTFLKTKKNLLITKTHNSQKILELNQSMDFRQTIVVRHSEKQASIEKNIKFKDFNYPFGTRQTNSLAYLPTNQFPSFQRSINPLIQKNSVRKTFQTTFRYKDSDDTIQQYKKIEKIETTLNYLQMRIFQTKKQLQKKKQKRLILQENNNKFDRTQKKCNLQELPEIEEIRQNISHKKDNRISYLMSRTSKPSNLKGFDFNPYSSKKHSVYYVSEIVRARNQKNSIAIQHLKSSIKYLKELENEKPPPQTQIQLKKLNLKRKQQYKDKKTLIFDLDETLMHCVQNDQIDCDIQLPVFIPTGEQIIAKINLRPHLLVILNQLKKDFELIIFTASHPCYANTIINYLDPYKNIFQHRLFRQHCYETKKGIFIKDLRIINRKLEDMVLIDNAAYSYAFQLQNGIPILPYYEGKNDYQFPALKNYLQKLITVRDVRQLNKRTFKLHRYTRYTNSISLIQELYKNEI